MAGTFDPYFKWLGIPAADQPPDHYRLLGIPLFVDDRDVISNGADQRMMITKSFQAGKHAGLTQQILNEITQAKVCLLNPENKAAYDAELKQELGAVERPKPNAAAPKPKPRAVAEEAPAPAFDFKPKEPVRPASAPLPGAPLPYLKLDLHLSCCQTMAIEPLTRPPVSDAKPIEYNPKSFSHS